MFEYDGKSILVEVYLLQMQEFNEMIDLEYEFINPGTVCVKGNIQTLYPDVEYIRVAIPIEITDPLPEKISKDEIEMGNWPYEGMLTCCRIWLHLNELSHA